MSGLIGFIDFSPNELDRLIQTVRERLCRFPWNTWDEWISPDGAMALGRVDIGVFNPLPQPATSLDGQVVVFLSGELYRTTALRRDLEDMGVLFQRNDDPELVLHAYLTFGIELIQRFEGAFHLVILDLRRHELLIANDRFGLRPLYYTQYKNRFAFAPEVKALTLAPDFEKQLSLVAVAEYMRFQQLLGEKTFFENIYLLPPSSLLKYDLQNRRLSLDAYWRFSEIQRLDTKTPYLEVVEESARLFQQAVDTLSADEKQVGLYLTGGLDSRLIAGCLAKSYDKFPMISYGDPQSIDVQLARRIASSLDTEHHVFEFTDGKWILQFVDLHLELTEGHHSWIHSHGISTLAEVRTLLDVNLTGFGVDTGLGGHYWDLLLNHAVDDYAFDSYFFYLYNQKYQWPGLNESEEQLLYTTSYRSRMQGLAFDSFRTEVHRLSHYPYEQRAEYFNMLNHNRRMTQNYIVFNSSHFENRFPGYDYRLFDFIYSFPLAWRPNRRLQQDVIEWINPHLALVPQAKDNLLFTRRTMPRLTHHIVTRFKQRVNRHITPIFREPISLYAGYENWLRHELRPWAEELLFDGRLADRGIFDPNAVKSLFERHMSGLEMHTIGKIAPIMTLEMMLRRYFD